MDSTPVWYQSAAPLLSFPPHPSTHQSNLTHSVPLPPALLQMLECFRTLPDLRKITLDPLVPIATKVKLMETLLADSSATEVTKRLFASLAETNTLAATMRVAEAYEELMLAHKKEVHCTIITSEVGGH